MSTDTLIFGISIVYFLAFSSLYIQLPGLAGDDGIQPVRLLDLSLPKNFQDFAHGILSVVRFKDLVNLSAYHCTEAVVLLGMLISFLSVVSPSTRGTVSLVILWICYYSVVKVVTTFLSWRWSLLLIEFGFLCILLSIKLRRCSFAPSAHILSWLLKWLLFRVTFSTGFTKMAQRTSDWWNLSAMHAYFMNQLSPTPFAHYLNNLPAWIYKLFCVAAISLELITPFLFFVPLRAIQLFSFITQFILHSNMLLTGNYGIYNILMIILLFSLILTPVERHSTGFNMRTLASWFVSSAIICFTVFVIATLFKVQLDGSTITCNVAFTYDQFRALSGQVILYTVPVAACLFAITVLYSLLVAFSSAPGCVNKILDITSVLITATLAAALFLASLTSFTALNSSTNNFVPVPSFLHELKSLHLVNDYRYFHQGDPSVVYKGNRLGRPTLVLEGAMSETGPWKELSFFHAPGKLDKMPPIIPGHLPAIEFELALAAKKTFETSPFTANLVYRILTRQKDVAQQMELTGFATGPKFVQIKSYNYRFPDTVSGKAWWKRTLQSVFLPPTKLETPELTKIVEKTLHIGRRRERPNDPTYISFILDQLRALVGQPRDVSSFITVVAVVYILNKLVR